MTLYDSFRRHIDAARAIVAPPEALATRIARSDRWSFVCATVQNNRLTAVWVNGYASEDAQTWYDLDRVRPDIDGTATLEGYMTDNGRFPLGLELRQQ